MRINKYIASCGVTSRRKADELIIQGKVICNGKVITEPGTVIDENKDFIRVNGKHITPENKKIYIMLNKPPGYVSAVTDDRERKTVLNLIKIKERIYPVGRLDYMSRGLLILTNDGNFMQNLTHPKFNVKKVYMASVKGKLSANPFTAFEKGIEIDGYMTKPAQLKLLGRKNDISTYEVTISEGRNRQIRKMFETIGGTVVDLKRIRIGNLQLGALEEGKYRNLKIDEIKEFL